MMNDKSNILGSLMGPNNKENGGETRRGGSTSCNGTRLMQPTSGSGGKQHKLKQRFTVIRKLGKGTYGKVQLAINKETGQEVAIKTIKKTKIENEQDLQRVRREIQIMSSIEHPHIIHIYEVFENKDKIVLVMQYAPGGELYEYVSQSKLLDDSEARRLFRQIATAIYYCHQNKICHRDLKLENILLDEKNNAKLADFGLSNVFDKSFQLKTFCGSPLYASPEIVQGSPYEGPEVDCWSLGVLLYTLVYGAMPFDGSNFKRLVKQISESCYFEPKQKSQASPLIRKLLCADPKERATIFDICSDPWVNGLATGPSNGLVPQIAATHQSLLKVAQDMANLTPVRFDILLALTPDSMAAAAAATSPGGRESAAAARPPLARLDNQKRRSSGGDASDAPSWRPTVTLDTSTMEVEEGRSTSPVASYIVRDLSNDKPTASDLVDMENIVLQAKIEDETQGIGEVELNDQVQRVTDKPEKHKPEQEEIVQQEQQVYQDQNDSHDEVIIEKDNHSMCEEDIATVEVNQVPFEDNKVVIETAIEAASDGENASPEEDSKSFQSVNKPNKDEVVKMDLDAQKNLGHEQLDALELEATMKSESISPVQKKENEDSQEQVAGIEESQKEVDVEQGASESRPKKVKKKVVVVKKRKKRVSKKGDDDDDSAAKDEDKSKADDKDKDKDADGQDSDTLKRQDQTDSVKSCKAKGPGKVRIPNTFQPQPANREPPPPVSKAESRRQSTLVADVSQKLLQQSAAPCSNTVNLIKSDQPQLASVRVSDKKSEFERRASLAVISPPNSKPVTPPLHQPELHRGELLHEPYSDEQLTIVEPVTMQEPLDIQPASLSGLRPPKQDESESPTPTAQRVSLDILMAADVERKLMECANRFGNEPQDQEPNAVNDRSDSVETIRADTSCSPVVLEAPSVKSHFIINLNGNNNNNNKSITTNREPETPRAVATGPAPITRSYKKVTFTKDGACITETGKIYSKQSDDGTVRRIERKSKVTHYPVKGDGFGSEANEARSEQVEEEEVYEEEDGTRRAIWEERQSSFLGQTKDQLRPLDRLIMPTEIDSDSFGPMYQEFATSGQPRPPSFSGRARSHSRQLGRADSSCSSCSSGSTDVFDDIFDHWTGAISMFNQASALGTHFRPFGGGRTSTRTSGSRRTPGGGGSLAGTPRCESAEPPSAEGSGGVDSRSGGHLHNRRRRHREWRSPGANTSGYESDAASDRPATAMGGTRGSLSRLFPSLGATHQRLAMDPFFADIDPIDSHFRPVDDLRLRTIAQEHESLRRRLEQQHKQLWKGSTPSLFAADDHPFKEPIIRPPRRHQSGVGVGSIGQLLREHNVQVGETASRAYDSGWRRPPRPESSSGSVSNGMPQQQHAQHQKPQQPSSAAVSNQQRQSWPRDNLGQSQPSSSLLRQSVALDPTPTRRNIQTIPTKLPPRHEVQTMRRSTSKLSLIASQLGEEDIEQQQQSIKHQASFIELKRTSSSTSAHQQRQVALITHQRHQQQQQEHESKATASSRVISNSGSSSAFWETVVTPTTPLSCATHSGPLEVDGNLSSTRDNLDSRVQSWLQESTGNMSTSSGSKSSVSEQSRQPDVSAKHGILRLRQLGPLAGDTSITQPVVSTRVSTASQKEASSTLVVSSSSSSANWASEKRQQQQQFESLKNLVGDDGTQRSADRQVTTRATFTLRQATTPSPEVEGATESFISKQQHQHQQVSSSQSSVTARRSTSTTTPLIGRMATEGAPPWVHESSSRSIFGEELEESLSGGCSADLESRSSSSLLDQLRSRGYRSMINQRMVSQQTGVLSEQTIPEQVSSSTSQVNRQETSSSSRVVTSTSSTRVIQQQHRQVITSSSSSSTQRKPMIEDDEVANTAAMSHPPKSVTYTHTPRPSPLKISAKPETNYQVSNVLEVGSTDPPKDSGVCTDETDQALELQVDQPSMDQIIISDDRLSTNEDKEVEEDEDVREAKASIKLHLDRVKETEMFLKSLHAEEAEAERQRQQLYLFNNLMLSTKCNGIKTRPRGNDELFHPDTTPIGGGASYTGPCSAPVYMMNSILASTPVESCPMTNGYMTRTQPSNRSILTEETDGCFGTLSSGYASRKLQFRPLPSLNATVNSKWSSNTMINGHESPPLTRYNPPPSCNADDFSGAPEFRRSRSQLGDQLLVGLTNNRRGGRPVSANLDSLGWTSRGSCEQTHSPYFPSRSRRSMSQIRQSSSRFSYAGSKPISEYPSSGCASPRVSRTLWSEQEASSMTELNQKSALVSDEDDDDHGLSAYRASAYVPKVVPQGMPVRGRSHLRQKRSLTTSDWTLDRPDASRRLVDLDTTRTSLKAYEETKLERRISLQEVNDRSDFRGPTRCWNDETIQTKSSSARKSSPNSRQRIRTSSLTENSSACGQGQRSRLSELEQRIQENKRRREELLSGRLSPEPKPESNALNCTNRVEKSTAPAISTTVKLNTRPSRLESMEARIKRRSYCVRTSPERSHMKSQQNPDKWNKISCGRRDSNGSTDSTSTGGSLTSSPKWTARISQTNTKE